MGEIKEYLQQSPNAVEALPREAVASYVADATQYIQTLKRCPDAKKHQFAQQVANATTDEEVVDELDKRIVAVKEGETEEEFAKRFQEEFINIVQQKLL